jgi:hypothetical protein
MYDTHNSVLLYHHKLKLGDQALRKNHHAGLMVVNRWCVVVVRMY